MRLERGTGHARRAPPPGPAELGPTDRGCPRPLLDLGRNAGAPLARPPTSSSSNSSSAGHARRGGGISLPTAAGSRLGRRSPPTGPCAVNGTSTVRDKTRAPRPDLPRCRSRPLHGCTASGATVPFNRHLGGAAARSGATSNTLSATGSAPSVSDGLHGRSSGHPDASTSPSKRGARATGHRGRRAIGPPPASIERDAAQISADRAVGISAHALFRWMCGRSPRVRSSAATGWTRTVRPRDDAGAGRGLREETVRIAGSRRCSPCDDCRPGTPPRTATSATPVHPGATETCNAWTTTATVSSTTARVTATPSSRRHRVAPRANDTCSAPSPPVRARVTSLPPVDQPRTTR